MEINYEYDLTAIENEQKKKCITFENEQYQISRIRRVKLVREIANGTQTRISKWVF